MAIWVAIWAAICAAMLDGCLARFAPSRNRECSQRLGPIFGHFRKFDNGRVCAAQMATQMAAQMATQKASQVATYSASQVATDLASQLATEAASQMSAALVTE